MTGKAQYGMDMRLPGMLYAVVARPPVLGGKVDSFDAAEAMKVPGVVKVFAIDGAPPPAEFQPLGGVVVVAKDTWAAIKGRKALKIDWDDGPHGSYDSEGLSAASWRRPQASPAARWCATRATSTRRWPSAAKKVEADYYVPHWRTRRWSARPRPRASWAARARSGRRSQSPQAARDRVAKRLNLPADKVTVNVTLLGGGFGRKSKADFVVEAALVSKEMDGQPVKLIWTREDDLHHDYFHTVSAQHLEAGLDANGKVVAWLHRTAEPTIVSIFAPDPKTLAPFELGLGLTGMPYADPEHADREPRGRGAHAHRLVPRGEQHPACVRGPVVHRRDGAGAGKDHRDYLLELLGPDRLIDPRKISETWNHGESPERYPINTGRLRKVIERATQEAELGQEDACGAGPGARGALQLRHLHGGGGGGGGRRQGRADDAARRHRGRLRRARSIPTACARRSRAPASWA